MDATLVTITVLSMGMAAALSVIVWRLLRDERRRSEARVMALASAASVDVAPASIPPEGRGHGAIGIPPEGGNYRSAPAARPDVPVVSAFRRNPDPPIARETPAADLPLHVGSEPILEPVMTSALFVEPERASPWGNRLAVMVGIVLLGASVSLFAMAAARSRATSSSAGPSVATLPPDAGPGLELLSLRDARQPGTLTITGLVQNARAGSLLSNVAVTAYAFDEKGAFLASGRALLDVTSLAPGDESPFVVSVPVTETVARYRIGFRGDDGRVIAHVDKRQSGPIAALRQDPGQVNR